ncbi:hypothetical protein XELAEV_18018480mg, partial [Xenopus laevis]
ADDFDPEDLNQKGAASGPVTVRDRWDGEDEEEDVKDNWDDEEEAGGAAKKEPQITVEQKVPEKKKLLEKIKEKEKLQKQRKEELKKQVQTLESSNTPELTPEEQLSEKLRLKKLQEDSDLELAKEAFGDDVTVTGIDAMNPSTREDFTEFGKLLKEKITLYERSLYYPGFLEALVRDVSLSLEVEDLKKINNSLTVLCFEKQKQEKVSLRIILLGKAGHTQADKSCRHTVSAAYWPMYGAPQRASPIEIWPKVGQISIEWGEKSRPLLFVRIRSLGPRAHNQISLILPTSRSACRGEIRSFGDIAKRADLSVYGHLKRSIEEILKGHVKAKK